MHVLKNVKNTEEKEQEKDSNSQNVNLETYFVYIKRPDYPSGLFVFHLVNSPRLLVDPVQQTSPLLATITWGSTSHKI